MKKTFLLVLISMPTFLFSQFGNERILIETLGTKYDVEYADLDNDGDQDVITAARRGLVWYENLLEQDKFSEPILIDKGFFIDLAVGDLDGDNDEDVVAISYQDIFTINRDIKSSIILYENTGINGFEPHLLIADELEYSFYQELNLFDKDKDGDLEILVGKKDISAPRSTDTLFIIDNLGNLSFEDPALFYTDESFEYDFSIHFPYDYDKTNLLDLDGDNILDLVIGVGSFYYSYYNSKIVAYLSSLDQFIQIHEPESPRVGFFNFSGMDYDNDGDIDLSVITQSKAFWLENDGSGLNYVEHILMDSTRIYRNSGSALFYNIIESSDFNQDGYRDIIIGTTANNYPLLGFAYQENGTFAKPVELTDSITAITELKAIDINQDGKTDFLTKGNWNNEINIYSQSTDGHFKKTIEISTDLGGIYDFYQLDFNQDGQLDFIASGANDRKIRYYENLGSNQYTIGEIIYGEGKYPFRTVLLDIDNDNIKDVVFSSNIDDIKWIKNNDNGTFGEAQKLEYSNESNLSRPIDAIRTKDLNNDGKEDIILLSIDETIVYTLVQEEGSRFRIAYVGEEIAAEPVGFLSHITHDNLFADFNGDGILDLLISVCEPLPPGAERTPCPRAVWYPGKGDGTFKKYIDFDGEKTNERQYTDFCDLDNDGDYDVIITTKEARFWYENDGQGNFQQREIFDRNEEEDRSLSIHVLCMDANSDGFKDLLIGKNYLLENDGNAQFQKHDLFGFKESNNLYKITDFDQDHDQDILLAGWNTIHWIENISGVPAINGQTFLDQNKNGKLDSLEFGIEGIQTTLEPESVAAFTGKDGLFKYYLFAGDYQVSSNALDGWHFTTDSIYSIEVGGLENEPVLFGLFPDTVINTMDISLKSSATRCGFEVPFWLDYKNTSTFRQDGKIGLVLDSMVSLLNTEPEIEYISGDTIFWNYESLTPRSSDKIRLKLQMPGVESIGDSIRFESFAWSADNELLGEHQYASLIRCAYDPNDKLIEPARGIGRNYTLFKESLKYTIRFQNTGTDTAFNVIIRDTLDENLDWNSFEPLSASHDFETLLHPKTGLVEFTFRNILLPDSIANEPLSHGYVNYRVKPKKGLKENTIIENTAAIYFDFNPPIITNTTQNTMVSKLPQKESLESSFQNLPTNLYPNPASNLITIELEYMDTETSYEARLFNSLGQMVAIKDFNDKRILQMNTENLPTGIYFVAVRDKSREKMVTYKKVLLAKTN